ncbi:MAG: ABC transporter substrate-binding protein [Anaerolineales bacterium]|nr:ABC transporter substrate-binding protein [Anaerolineales bacterium]MCX7608950.1 ABC transporter substrate-binding protein [Anaerolineales bacterium]
MWRFYCYIFLLFGLVACAAVPTPENIPTQEVTAEFSGRKILWVDSYHAGYEWSDGIERGLRSILEPSGAQLEIFRMDTKRNPDLCQQAGQQAWQTIQTFQPDVVIATDDNAQKCLVLPYLKGTELPVIFAGVNWSVSEYKYPAPNVTGMIEVDLIDRLIEMVSPYARGSRIGFISIDTETERKIAGIYNSRFFNGAMNVYWPKTQTEFMELFLQAQQENDILIVLNNAGAPDWDETTMKTFFREHTTVPTISVNPWMAPYVLATLAKLPEEQGEWAAQTALQILQGTPVNQIAIAQNKRGRLILNLSLAEKLQIILPPSLLKNAEIIQ